MGNYNENFKAEPGTKSDKPSYTLHYTSDADNDSS